MDASLSGQTSAPESAPSQGLNQGARIVGVFLSPSKTFADFNRSAACFAPYLLLVIVSLAFGFTIDRKIGFTAMAEQAVQTNAKMAEQLDKLPADQRAQRLAFTGTIIKCAVYASPLTLLLTGLVIGSVLMGTFNFVLGKELKAAACFAVVFYAMLPSVIYTSLAILVLLFSGRPQDVNIQNMVATNPAYFLDQANTSPLLYQLLRSLDIFSLWQVALTGLGFSAIGGGKRSTALAIVGGWWLLLVLVMAGVALLKG